MIFYVNPLLPQDYQRELISIPVRNDHGLLSNIFSGGINNFEFQFIDIDNDGDYDIPYLDSDGTFGIYMNTGSKTDPSFELLLDAIQGLSFYDWFYFIDIDNDSDYDIFTGMPGAKVSLIKNTGTKEEPFFLLNQDTVKDDEGDPIYSENGSNPAFADIDNDGDDDFISGNSNGSLNFYENTGTSTEFNFRFITATWQNLIIISGGAKAQSTSGTELHGSSSIDFADIDADGDLDLFWGDFFSRSLFFIQNNGTASNAQMSVVNDFYPPSGSIITSGFNMPRLIDIDSDEDMDLFVSVLYDPTVTQSLIFYRNEGSTQSPDFIKVTDNYLNTLDAGTQSLPVFADIDGDEDTDMFIGSSRNPFGSIMFFENTGTGKTPSFIFRDSAYFNIEGELSLAPQFADLNGDNLTDLITGNFSGQNYLYLNSGTLTTPVFDLKDTLLDNSGNIIDAGTLARPFLKDIDSDGDIDLILGSFNGRIVLYRNVGSMAMYSFSEESEYFADLDAGSNSAPYLLDYDSDGDFDLFCGTHNGNIFYFLNNGSIGSPQWSMITDSFLGFNFGADAAPVFIDYDSDGDLDIFIGNSKGGLYLFKNNELTSVDTKDIIEDYFLLRSFPNPFNSSATIRFRIPFSIHTLVSLTVYNYLGQKILTLLEQHADAGDHSVTFHAPDLSSGVYFVRLTAGALQLTKKIVLLK